MWVCGCVPVAFVSRSACWVPVFKMGHACIVHTVGALNVLVWGRKAWGRCMCVGEEGMGKMHVCGGGRHGEDACVLVWGRKAWGRCMCACVGEEGMGKMHVCGGGRHGEDACVWGRKAWGRCMCACVGEEGMGKMHVCLCGGGRHGEDACVFDGKMV